MKNVFAKAFLGILLSISFSSYSLAASSWAFTNLTQDDVNTQARELGANTTLHSVMPPSSLGSIFGFEVGIVGGKTASPGINDIAHRVDPSTNTNSIFHGALLGAVTVPFGITGEITLFPRYSASDMSYEESALAAKWTFTDLFWNDLPINMALRGFVAKSQADWTQTSNGTVFTATSENELSGVQFLLSPKYIPVLEPYIGIGMVNTKGKLSHNAGSAVPVFADGSTSKDAKLSSSQLILGVDAHVLLFGLGLEYSKVFDTSSWTAKFSMKF